VLARVRRISLEVELGKDTIVVEPPPTPDLGSTSGGRLVTSVLRDSGTVDGGRTVVVRGLGFDGASGAKLGDDCRRFLLDSPTTLICVTKPHAVGKVDLVITTPSGPITHKRAYDFVKQSSSPCDGTTPDPSVVCDLGQLAQRMADGNPIVLGDNIDFDLDPAHTPFLNPGPRKLTVALDGKGFAIAEATIALKGAVDSGLFTDIDGGSVQNLALIGMSVSTESGSAGGLSARLTAGTISGVSVTGNVTGSHAGGLIGVMPGSASNQISDVNLRVVVEGVDEVGGLIGSTKDHQGNLAVTGVSGDVAVKRCSQSCGGLIGLAGSSGKLSITGVDLGVGVQSAGGSAGGLVGKASSATSEGIEIRKVRLQGAASGLVAGKDGSNVGGLVGDVDLFMTLTVSDAEIHGAVSGLFSTGGVVGILASGSKLDLQRSIVDVDLEASSYAGGAVGLQNDDLALTQMQDVLFKGKLSAALAFGIMRTAAGATLARVHVRESFGVVSTTTTTCISSPCAGTDTVAWDKSLAQGMTAGIGKELTPAQLDDPQMLKTWPGWSLDADGHARPPVTPPTKD
jgi:hypothetical protein